jgi:hypothetical protein
LPAPSLSHDVDVLAQPVLIADGDDRVRLLDMSAMPITMLGKTLLSLATRRDAILDAIDVILHG